LTPADLPFYELQKKRYFPFGRPNGGTIKEILNEKPPAWVASPPKRLTKTELYFTARVVAAESRGHHPKIPDRIRKLTKDPYVRCLIGDMVPFYRLFESAYESMSSKDGSSNFVRNAINITKRSLAFLVKKEAHMVGFQYWLFFKSFLKENLRRMRYYRDRRFPTTSLSGGELSQRLWV